MPDKRTIQPEDLFNLRFLNGGKLSPDASQVVYTVSQINAEQDKEYSTIFLLDLGSGSTKQLTNGKARDGNPQWSADGKSIAFVSDRDGKQQLYLLPVDGGEARQLTEAKRGIGGGFAWSPDGRKIAFSAVPTVEPIDLGKEPYRVDRTVYRFDAIGYLDQTIQDVFLLDLTSGETRQLTNDRTNNVNLRWSPDGSEILYDATMRADAALAMIPDLMTVDLNGNRKPILQGWASIEGANFTPDGKQIVFVGRPDDGKPIGTKSDLYLLDIETRRNRKPNGRLANRNWWPPVAGHARRWIERMECRDHGRWPNGAYDGARGWHSPYLPDRLERRRIIPSRDKGRVRRVSAGSAGRSAALCEYTAKRATRFALCQHDRRQLPTTQRVERRSSGKHRPARRRASAMGKYRRSRG